jgi:hypothetical protein
MVARAFTLLILTVNISSCQNRQTSTYDKRIVEKPSAIGVLGAPFMVDEIIEIYKKDSLVVKRTFNSEAFSRTKYTRYCFDVCVKFFHDKLMEKRSRENSAMIDRIISDLNFAGVPQKPDINWARIFESCLTCPFAEYPDELFFYFKFSLMHMNEKEIIEMIKNEDGEQWKYALMAIKGGDSFTLNKEENYQQFILDRRIANYIIERWKNSNIKEIQELIAVYKSIM